MQKRNKENQKKELRQQMPDTVHTHTGIYEYLVKQKIIIISIIITITTMVLHYYYCIKYSNSNGFLKAIV